MDELDELIARFEAEVRTLMARLESGNITPEAWQAEFENLLARYHTASSMTGVGSDALPPAVRSQLVAGVQAQFAFLDGFRIEIQDTDEYMAGWNARADMYAKSIKTPYWQGRTRMLPLPAMPAEGTQCLTNCGCLWDIVTIDEEAGDYDCFWRRGKDDSCQTCIAREQNWSPLQVRGGVLL
jgi:hypothetical protein